MTNRLSRLGIFTALARLLSTPTVAADGVEINQFARRCMLLAYEWPLCAIGLNRSRGRALGGRHGHGWTMGACCAMMKGQIFPEPMMVQHNDRAIAHRQRWERSFEYPN